MYFFDVLLKAVQNDDTDIDIEKGVIAKEQCIAAYAYSLKKCDADSERLHSFSALVGSITYALDLSGFVQEGSPLRDQQVSFPPSEDRARLTTGNPYRPQCHDRVPSRRTFLEDLETAITSLCINGALPTVFNKDVKV
jgi:hypothetical protein